MIAVALAALVALVALAVGGLTFVAALLLIGSILFGLASALATGQNRLRRYDEGRQRDRKDPR
jgi:hypothetical protein